MWLCIFHFKQGWRQFSCWRRAPLKPYYSSENSVPFFFLTLLTMQQNAFLLIIHFIIKGQFNHKNVCGSGYHCSTSKEFCIACNWPGNLNKKSLIAHLLNANSAVHSAWLVEDMGEHSAAKLPFLPLHSTAKQTVQMAYCHHGLCGVVEVLPFCAVKSSANRLYIRTFKSTWKQN